MPIRKCPIPKKSVRKGKDASISEWFKERRKEMTGRCANCNGDTCKNDDTYYKFSIAHILAKSVFKSVATHESNWVELCFFGNSCHSNLDNGMLNLSELNCFDEVVEKFQKMYPFIAEDEKRRIPNILRNYIDVDI